LYFLINELEEAMRTLFLVAMAAVIASHANEVATKDGKLIPGTKTDAFIKAVSVPTHVPLSGKTMEFNGGGRCVGGC
jgi:hypothetical protein